MRCNLPEGFRASVTDRAEFDSPKQYVVRSMPQVDRRNMPMGYNESPKMAYGTGRNYNFTNNARARRNAQVCNNRNAMDAKRMNESARVFANMTNKYSCELEM